MGCNTTERRFVFCPFPLLLLLGRYVASIGIHFQVGLFDTVVLLARNMFCWMNEVELSC